MANTPDSPNLFNPLWWWTDLGLRAAESAVASTQSITDGADRVTRAVAGAEADAIEHLDPRSDPRTRPAPPGLAGIGSMQRLAWDLMVQNWMRWMSAVGSILSAGAGGSLAHKADGQDNPLETVRDNLGATIWGETPPRAKAAVIRASTAQRRQARSATSAVQHALASDQPKARRKKAPAPSRRARRSSRK